MEEYPIVFSHPHSPPQILPHTVNIELSSRSHYISNGTHKKAQIRFPEGTPAISHKIDVIQTSQAKREKSDAVPKWTALEQNFFRSLDSLSSLKWIDKIGQVMARCTSCIVGQAANIVSIIASPSQVITVKEKVHSRHLELEPLCCLSSCLVRGGCYAILVFELMYIVVTLLIVGFKIYSSGRLNFWDEFEENFNEVVTHQLWLYLLVVFDLVTIVAVFTLFRGLVAFDRKCVKMHWRYDFIALGFNIVAFVAYLFALSSEGPQTWTLDNIVLVVCFGGQIPLQLWAITVVKSCYDFFVFLYVFVSLAEKG